MAQGRISLLVDSPLRDLMLALSRVPTDVKRNIGRHTKAEAKPIWLAETRERGTTRIQQRVLVSSADVSVTARQVTLVSGQQGALKSGTPVVALATAAEFGLNASTSIQSRSRRGKSYTRRAGTAFGPRARRGNVALPAAQASIPRLVSLWVQTAYRTIHDAIEKA